MCFIFSLQGKSYLMFLYISSLDVFSLRQDLKSWSWLTQDLHACENLFLQRGITYTPLTKGNCFYPIKF